MTFAIKDLVEVDAPWDLEPGDLLYLNPKISLREEALFIRNRFPALVCDVRIVEELLKKRKELRLPWESKHSIELKILFATGDIRFEHATNMLVYDPLLFRSTGKKVPVYLRKKRQNEQ